MPRARGLCQLACGEPGVAAVCGFYLCASCIQRIRIIAHDAGVVVDESLISGTLRRRMGKRALTKAEQELEDNIERREIAAARRTA